MGKRRAITVITPDTVCPWLGDTGSAPPHPLLPENDFLSLGTDAQPSLICCWSNMVGAAWHRNPRPHLWPRVPLPRRSLRITLPSGDRALPRGRCPHSMHFPSHRHPTQAWHTAGAQLSRYSGMSVGRRGGWRPGTEGPKKGLTASGGSSFQLGSWSQRGDRRALPKATPDPRRLPSVLPVMWVSEDPGLARAPTTAGPGQGSLNRNVLAAAGKSP